MTSQLLFILVFFAGLWAGLRVSQTPLVYYVDCNGECFCDKDVKAQTMKKRTIEW